MLDVEANLTETDFPVKIDCSALRYALQPIISLQNGACMGVEALVRGVDLLGFPSIDTFFDHLHRQGILFETDLQLRLLALRTFTRIPFHQQLRLFYNLDNRILCAPRYRPGLTQELLKPLGLQNRNICFEISEKHDVRLGGDRVLDLTRRYRRQGFQMAIDDFGTGYSGLRLLYEMETDLIKIDRFSSMVWHRTAAKGSLWNRSPGFATSCT